MLSEEIREEDISELVSMLKSAGYDNESDFVKEAGWKDMPGKLWEGVKNVGGNIANTMFEPVRLQKSRDKLTQIVDSIKPELAYVNKVIQQVSDPQKPQIQGIVNALSQMAELGNKAIGALDQASTGQQPQADSNIQTSQPQTSQPQTPQPQTPQPQEGQTAGEDAFADQGQKFFYKGKNHLIQFDQADTAFIDVPGEGKYQFILKDGKWALTPYKGISTVPLEQATTNTGSQPFNPPKLAPTDKLPLDQPVSNQPQDSNVKTETPPTAPSNVPALQSGQLTKVHGYPVKFVRYDVNGQAVVQDANGEQTVDPSELNTESSKKRFNLMRYSGKK